MFGLVEEYKVGLDVGGCGWAGWSRLWPCWLCPGSIFCRSNKVGWAGWNWAGWSRVWSGWV
jgi:hypothetical protein